MARLRNYLLLLLLVFITNDLFSQDVILGTSGRRISSDTLYPTTLASNFANFPAKQRRSYTGNTIYDIMDDNTGEIFSVTKRIYIGGRAIVDSLVDNKVIFKKGTSYYVKNFRGAVEVTWFVSDTSATTDVTADFQKAINTAILVRRKLHLDDGSYRINGTLYVNKPIGQPFTMYGDADLSKDYQTQPADRGAVLFKYNSGDIIRINMKADGTPYRGATDYSLNIGMIGFSLRGSDTANVTGITGYRIRGKYESLGGVYLNYLIHHNWVGPVGYVGWNNYSDQSIYRNNRIMYSTKGGIRTTNADASTIEGFYFEYPKYGCVEGLYVRNSMGVTIKNVLHSNGNHEQNIVDTSSFIVMDVSRGWSIEGVHAENIEFKNLFRTISAFGWHISNVHTRFNIRNLLYMYRTRGGRFTEYYEWVNTKDPNDYDFYDQDSTSTKFTWDNLHMINFVTFVEKPLKTNRPEADTWGPYLYKREIENLVYVKWEKAVYNYSSNPNYAMTTQKNVELPSISQNTNVRLLNPAQFPNTQISVINRNRNVDYNTTLSGYSIWKNDSTTMTTIPHGVSMILQSDSTRWNLVSITKSFPLKDSSTSATQYMNVNNSRFGENGSLFITVSASSENYNLDLPSASSVKGYTIWVMRTDTSSYYVRAKSVIGTQTVNGTTAGDTIRGQWTSRIYKSDGENWFVYKSSPLSLVQVSADATLSLTNDNTDFIFSGTTSTWTLPVITGNKGKVIYIKNRGSGDVTLNSNGGGNDIYNTSAVNTLTITPGSGYRLVNDGTYWNVFTL